MYFYVVFESLLVALKYLFGDAWQIALVVVNAIAQSLTVVFLARLVFQLTGNIYSSILAAVCFLSSFEIINWSRYILSDTIFTCLYFLIFYIFAQWCLTERKQKSYLMYRLAFLACLILFFRPTGLFAILPIAIGCAIYVASGRNRSFKTFPTVSVLLMVVGCLAAIVFHSWLVADANHWPFNFARKYLELIASDYRKGTVVFERFETYNPQPKTLFDYAFITVEKNLAFFAMRADGFSTVHTILSVGWLLPMYFGSLFLLVHLVSRFSNWDRRQMAIILTGFLAIFLVSFFQALTQIDYDWRYRLPVLPMLVLLSTLGFDRLFFAIQSRIRKSKGLYATPSSPSNGLANG